MKPHRGSLEYVRRTYKVPAKRGGRVRVAGHPGKIIGGINAHLLVLFDGAKFSRPCHPTWEVEYLDAGGTGSETSSTERNQPGASTPVTQEKEPA